MIKRILKKYMKHVFVFFYKNPFFSLTCGVLVIISLTSLRPDLYFLGWDSFPSYLNIPLSFDKTLFSAWRGYRGLGVASDSEIVDIFRQLFFIPLSLVFSKPLLDQLYLLFSLWLGTILMYLFAYKLYVYTFSQHKEHEHSVLESQGSHRSIGNFLQSLDLSKYSHLFAFLASFFYLFNLSTLSVFFFPILPYITRFSVIPALHLFVLYWFTNKKVSSRLTLAFVLLILFTSTSYLTATVFITMLLSLALHVFSYFRIRRAVIFFLVFLGLNLFWLVPFSNYAIQKSYDVQFATSNLEGNETLLNRAAEFFSPQKQLIFYPTFFSMQYFDPITSVGSYFHPLATTYNKVSNIGLYVFPLLYISGSILIVIVALYVFRVRKKQGIWHFPQNTVSLVWIPLQVIIFMALSLKEYGPTGFVYTFLAKNIPFFAVIFRFGDIKFHPFVAFAGALAAGFAFIAFFYIMFPWGIEALCTLKKKVFDYKDAVILRTIHACIYVFLFLIIIFPFKSYFTGMFIGPFMYTKIPSAYFTIADMINKDPAPVRVLHVPFDKNGYWRSYSWGYFGSSFFNFMINKPYIDRTFEPASRENAYLNNRIYALQEYIQALDTDKDKEVAAKMLHALLQEANIKYLILDETVNIQNLARGEKYWGTVSAAASKAALDLLSKYGYIKTRAQYNINPYLYSTQNKVKERVVPDAIVLPQHIALFEVVNTLPRVDFVSKVKNIDPLLANLAETQLYPSGDATLIQDKEELNAVLYPFQRRDAFISQTNKSVSYALPNTHITSGLYTIQTQPKDQSDSRLVKISVSRIQDNLVISAREIMAPPIQAYVFEGYIGSISYPLKTTQRVGGRNTIIELAIADLRLRVGESIFPLPQNLSEQETILTEVLVRQNPFSIELLGRTQEVSVSTTLLTPTTPTDCLGTKLKGYYANVDGADTNLKIESRNGSICILGDIDSIIPPKFDYGEWIIHIKPEDVDLDSVFTENNPVTSSPLFKTVEKLEKPTNMYICIHPEGVDTCYNPYKFFSLNGEKTITLPIIPSSGITAMRFVFGLRNIGYQEQRVRLFPMSVVVFDTLQSYQVMLAPNDPFTATVQLSNADTLQMKLPKTTSVASSYNGLGAYNMTFLDAPCEDKSGYRTSRLTKEFMISFSLKCGNGLFYTHKDVNNEMYLWLVEYNLISGQFPTIKIYDEQNEFTNERASLHQGYPNIPQFKTINPLNSVITERTLTTIKPVIGSYILHPSSAVQNGKNKVFAFTQYSDNDGAVAIKSFNIVALPPQWSNLTITSAKQITTDYKTPQIYSMQQVLPSLWEVTLDKNTPIGTYMLLFREGYDAQWNLFASPFDMLTGTKIQAKHDRCNGLFNCFALTIDKPFTKDKVIYLFYEPEKLSVLGIGLTLIVLLSIVGFGVVFTKKRYA